MSVATSLPASVLPTNSHGDVDLFFQELSGYDRNEVDELYDEFELLVAQFSVEAKKADADIPTLDFPNGINKIGATYNGILRTQIINILQSALAAALKPGADPLALAQRINSQLAVLLDAERSLEKELDGLVKAGKRPDEFLFKNRQDRSQSAADFCRAQYGRFLDAGVLSKDKLRKLDSYLTHCLYMNPNGINLPTKSQRVDAAVAGQDDKELMRTLSAIRRRKAA